MESDAKTAAVDVVTRVAVAEAPDIVDAQTSEDVIHAD